MRTGNSLVHNAGWYNSNGDKIGWGDDPPALQAKLKPGELLILGESDSFWNFVTNVGAFGWTSVVKPTEQSPGQEYVAKFARWVITNDAAYIVDAYNSDYDYGFPYKAITRGDAEKLIATGT